MGSSFPAGGFRSPRYIPQISAPQTEQEPVAPFDQDTAPELADPFIVSTEVEPVEAIDADVPGYSLDEALTILNGRRNIPRPNPDQSL